MSLDRGRVDGLADADLLWVDVDSAQEGALEALTAVMPVTGQSLFAEAAHKPFIHDYGGSLVLGVAPGQCLC